MNIHQTLYDFMTSYREKDDRIALIRGGAKMPYKKLLSEVDRVAAGLTKLGVNKGDVVMLALPNIFQGVVALYAISRIGAIAGMIHPLLSADEFAAAVQKQRPKAVFMSDINVRAFYSRCEGAKRIICPFLAYGYIGLPRAKELNPFSGDGEEPALYMQSGGTAGAPKTIVLSSRAVNAMAGNLLDYVGDKFCADSRMLTVLPMFHGFGLCIGVHTTLSASATSVLVPQFKAKNVARVIGKNKITTVLAVPRMITKLLDCKSFAGECVSSLKDVFVGGDNVGDDLAARFDERMREGGSKARLYPGYGLTETVTVCTLTKDEVLPTCVGYPINGMTAKIVDENLKEVKVGEVGELILAGDQLMSGYLDDELATEVAFESIDGQTFVHTGDFFRQDEQGRLYFAGRKKRLIKISGMNVFPAEIERIAQKLPFIGECVAVQYRVNGKPFIRLLVEGELDDTKKVATIEYIKEHMSHWNVPSDIMCIEEFPRTKVGKIDVAELENTYGDK